MLFVCVSKHKSSRHFEQIFILFKVKNSFLVIIDLLKIFKPPGAIDFIFIFLKKIRKSEKLEPFRRKIKVKYKDLSLKINN